MDNEQALLSITTGLGLIYCAVCNIFVQPTGETQAEIADLCKKHNSMMGHPNRRGAYAQYLTHARVLRELTSPYTSVPLKKANRVTPEFLIYRTARHANR